MSIIQSITLASAKRKASKHYREARENDTTGVNHGVVKLEHPEHGVIALACLCGDFFYVHPLFKDEAVKREDYYSEKEYRRAFRVQFGLKTRDVSPAKARKMRGKKRSKSKRPSWVTDASRAR